MAENENQSGRKQGDMQFMLPDVYVRANVPIETIGKPTLPRRLALAVEYHQNRLSQLLRNTFVYEIERGFAFNLVPILIGSGIVLYFHAPAEPIGLMLGVAALGFGIIVAKSKGVGVSYRLFSAIFCIMIGMLAAKIAVLNSDSPRIGQQITGELSGTVISTDQNTRGGPRHIISPDRINGVETSSLPQYVRLSSTSKAVVFEPGMQITGMARIQPVLGPAYPDGYDFSFFARFDGIGGSGFFMGKPSHDMNTLPDLTSADQFRVSINTVRMAIKKRIESALPGNTGKIATALVIGDRSGIPAEAQEALRATGLAHILAISGLHMALVALTTLWLLRVMFTLNANWALNYPIKKWAALGAFLLASIYLMISGFGVATQRAWIMISVMLVAVMMDRRAITLRNVSISAIIILLLDPSSLLGPGFQMSFAAVVALVSAYEAINRRRRDRLHETPFRQYGWVASAIRGAAAFSGGLFITSLVAGFATSFIAAWHFHQIAPLGLLANMLAMPIVTLVVMPAVLFSIVMIPFGLDPYVLMLVSYGINAILDIALWVNSLMNVAITGEQTAGLFILFLTGFGLLTLFKSRIRLAGVVILGSIPVFATSTNVPDILIAESGRAVAVKDAQGQLVTLISKRENFVTRIWGKAYSKGSISYAGLPSERCNRDQCVYELQSGLRFYLVYDPELLPNACNKADILAAPRLKWVNCREKTPQLILKREDFESLGAHEIYVQAQTMKPVQQTSVKSTGSNKNYTIRVKTAFTQPKRPWDRMPVTYQD